MKRLLPIVFILVIVHAVGIHFYQSGNMTQRTTGNAPSTAQAILFFDQSPSTPQSINAFAWQTAPPSAPIEETEHISWWWWVLGVILVVSGGMLLYVLIKKDPRKDA